MVSTKCVSIEQALSTLPPLYSTENIPTSEKKITVLIEGVLMGWKWFPVEYCPDEKVFFGYVKGFENEWGYTSVREIRYILPFANMIEPTNFSEIE